MGLPKVLNAEEAQVARDIDELVGGNAKDMAFSGAYDGAAQFDKQIATWAPPLQSADADILPDKSLLDARSRDMARNDAYVAGGEALHKDSIVGHMFVLNAKPNVEVLGWTPERTQAFQKEVEAKFDSKLQVGLDQMRSLIQATSTLVTEKIGKKIGNLEGQVDNIMSKG